MDPVLKLDNDPIQFVKEAKFLGLIWDTKLTFEPHIKYLKARCQKSLNILKVLSRTEWGADRTTLLKLYRSLVKSKLDYGCVVYGSASKTALAKLDPVHNQGLRLSLGAFRSSPVESLYVEAHEPPLEIRREKLAQQYTIKLKANPGNPAYDVVFNPKYQHLYANKDSATDSFGIYCKKLLKEAKMDVGEIAINSIPDVPIWDSEPVTVDFPPKVLLLCRSWGACVPCRSHRLRQLEFRLLVGTTMLDRLWARGQTKCNTPLMLATSVFGRILRRPCYVMAQPKSRLDIPWPNDAECMGHVWYHFSCWYPLLFDVESLAGCVGG